jgi:hypothetical protein
MQPRHLALGVFLVAIWWASIVHAGPSIYPTGVTRYDPGKAYNIFVLFSGSDDKTHLIEMTRSPGTSIAVIRRRAPKPRVCRHGWRR